MLLPSVVAVTHPVELMVPTAVLLLLQVPPFVASVRQLVLLMHMLVLPVIATGLGLTVMVVSATQPNGEVAMILAVPPVTPVTTPVVGSTVATLVLPLLQVTPAVASVSKMVLPTHTFVGPEITAVALTVSAVTAVQPPATV